MKHRNVILKSGNPMEAAIMTVMGEATCVFLDRREASIRTIAKCGRPDGSPMTYEEATEYVNSAIEKIRDAHENAVVTEGYLNV